jgi:hypothetical protein
MAKWGVPKIMTEADCLNNRNVGKYLANLRVRGIFSEELIDNPA